MHFAGAQHQALSPAAGKKGPNPWTFPPSFSPARTTGAAPSFESLAPRPLVPVALEPLISLPAALAARGRRAARHDLRERDHARASRPSWARRAGSDMELELLPGRTPRGAAGCVRDAGLPRAPGPSWSPTAPRSRPSTWRSVLAAHHASGAAVTVVVHRDGVASASPTPGGRLRLRSAGARPRPGERFPGHQGEPDPAAAPRGRARPGARGVGFCPHVFDAQTYLEVNQWMLERLARDDAERRRPACTRRRAWSAGARLVGPVQLGAGARVAAGATVVGPTSIGAESHRRARRRGRALGACGAAARSATGRSCTAASWATEAVVPPGATRLQRGDGRRGSPRRPTRPGPWRSRLAAAERIARRSRMGTGAEVDGLRRPARHAARLPAAAPAGRRPSSWRRSAPATVLRYLGDRLLAMGHRTVTIVTDFDPEPEYERRVAGLRDRGGRDRRPRGSFAGWLDDYEPSDWLVAARPAVRPPAGPGARRPRARERRPAARASTSWRSKAIRGARPSASRSARTAPSAASSATTTPRPGPSPPASRARSCPCRA